MREADGLSFFQILPPPSCRYNLRRLPHLHHETPITTQGGQTQSREARRILGRGDLKGSGLLLGGFVVLFDVADMVG